jgi:hypothetical protein
MWYWDFAPPSWHHVKKPLTKAQIKKLEQAYAQAWAITEEVKTIETSEQEQTQQETEVLLKFI